MRDTERTREMTTVAERIARTIEEGDAVDVSACAEACAAEPGARSRRDDEIGMTVWTFADGSRIGLAPRAWDLLLPCGRCWEGGGCECEETD